jgi:hypothetical protein
LGTGFIHMPDVAASSNVVAYSLLSDISKLPKCSK